MKKTHTIIIISFLVLMASACSTKALTPKYPSQKIKNYPAITIPKTISVKNILEEQQKYTLLAVDHQQRETLRRKLISYLVPKTRHQIHDSPNKAFKNFLNILALYTPEEVYAGPTPNKELKNLAKRFAAYYSPRGDTKAVIPALSVYASLCRKEAEKKRIKENMRALIKWVNQTAVAMYGKSAVGHKVIPVLEKTTQIWPSEFIIHILHQEYEKQRKALANIGPLRTFFRRHGRINFPQLKLTGYNIARHYLWVKSPYLALKKLREQPKTEANTDLIRILEQAVSPSANIDDQLRLAEEFESKHPRVALSICQSATIRYPKNSESHLCVGRLASATNHPLTAIDAFEKALKLKPMAMEIREALAKQYEQRIYLYIDSEQLSSAQKELSDLEVFYQETKNKLGKRPKHSLDSVYFAIGFGLFNAGRIKEAKISLKESIAQKPSIKSYYQLALINIKSRRGPEALKYLEAAEEIEEKSIGTRLFWHARIAALKARAHELTDRKKAARIQHKLNIVRWVQFIRLSPKPSMLARSQIQIAKSYYYLGKREKAITALERAIDIAPSRKETYPEAVSLLIRWGHLPEALDAYHRALGRREVSEYLKTYCSLWVIDMARRAKVQPDRLALNYLSKLKGSKWYNELAKLMLGKKTYQELKLKAKNTGQQTELSFYYGQLLAQEGKLDQAKRHWHSVIRSKMMGFFEYDMSNDYLHQGLPKVFTSTIDRRGN